MIKRLIKPSIISLVILTATAALGQDAATAPATPPAEPAPKPMPPVDLEIKEPLKNKIALSYRMGLNITVDFKKLGGFPAISDPGPALGITNRNYDNGSYNFVDVSGNAGGMTWFWGYENASQLQGGGLVMESASSPADVTSKNQEDGPQHGMEVSYSRELHRDEKWRFGAEAAVGWTSINIEDSRRLHGNINRIIDTYTIPDGVVIPAAPYHGTFLGPGALINALPDRNTMVISREAEITGERKLDANVYTLRLGPYFEVPIYKKLSFTLNGGLTLAIGDVNFSYKETVTIEGSGSVEHRSSGSQTDFLVGGYVGGNLSYALTEKIGAFAGVQYQAAGESVTKSRARNGVAETKKESVLDLGEALIVVIGVSYSF